MVVNAPAVAQSEQLNEDLEMESSQLESLGYQVIDEFLQPEDYSRLLDYIADYRMHHDLPEIYRPAKARSLRYSVIDGDRIHEHLNAIWLLYQGAVRELVNGLSLSEFVPLASARVGVNVNIMPPGRSEYRWHYDRNAVTVILYLNDVEGGETVLYPRYRILLKNQNHLFLQQVLDKLLLMGMVRNLFGKKIVIKPRSGRLAVMYGNQCWHSVRPVYGTCERVNVLFAYDVPGAQFPMENALDSYLYTQEKLMSSDPNYG